MYRKTSKALTMHQKLLQMFVEMQLRFTYIVLKEAHNTRVDNGTHYAASHDIVHLLLSATHQFCFKDLIKNCLLIILK